MANDDPAQDGSDAGTRERSPAFANAYAVSYRLLGDRDLATEVAATVGARYSPRQDEPAPDWLPDVAHDSVVTSLDTAQAHPEEMQSASHASTRAALRRRLAGADGSTRVAVGLHHLAGYTVHDTAALMTYGTEAVAERCRAFDPPPGQAWADMGDPLTRSARPVTRRRDSGRHFPLFPVVVAVLVLVVGIWAVTSIGERPTLDEGTPDGTSDATEGDGDPGSAGGSGSSGTTFSASLDPLPGAGCADPAAPAAEPGSTSTRELGVEDATVTYRLTVPAGDGAAPLVVSVGDADQGAAAFQEASKLEEALPEVIHATLEPPAEGTPPIGTSVVPAVVDALIGSQCVDLARVSVVGFGAGGPAAADAACESSELVAAAAMVSGFREPDGCELDPTSAVFIAARDDDPSVDSGTALEEVGTAWAAVAGADTDEVDGRDEETLVRTWQGPGGVEVQTVSATEGGHAWSTTDTNDVVAFIASMARSTS